MIIAIMMKKSNESSLGAQEREAYASAEFAKYCNDIDEATANEALLKLELTQAQMEFEAWRSEQATNRNIERITRWAIMPIQFCDLTALQNHSYIPF